MKSHVLTLAALLLFAISGFSQTDVQIFRQLETQLADSQSSNFPFTITSKSELQRTKLVEHARGEIQKNRKGIESTSLKWFAKKGGQENTADRASGIEMFITPVDNIVVILDMNNGKWRMRLQDVQLDQSGDGVKVTGKYQNGTHTEVFEINLQTQNLMTASR
jgi:hypothetical protein